MAKTQDYTKIMQDMLGAFPVDLTAFNDAFKSTASMNEKFAKVALDAAEKSAEISTKWTRETLSKLGEMAAVKEEPADYTKAMTDFAATQAELAAENMAAFAEVAKKVQMDTVELVMTAGKELGEEASAAMRKATSDAVKTAKKAAPAATK